MLPVQAGTAHEESNNVKNYWDSACAPALASTKKTIMGVAEVLVEVLAMVRRGAEETDLAEVVDWQRMMLLQRWHFPCPWRTGMGMDAC